MPTQVALANSTKYGLAASVWTSTLNRAHDVAARIDAGTVWVNCWLHRELHSAHTYPSSLPPYPSSLPTAVNLHPDPLLPNPLPSHPPSFLPPPSYPLLPTPPPTSVCSYAHHLPFPLVCPPPVPFGGVKASGVSREGGLHSLDFYSEASTLCVKLGDTTPPPMPGGPLT